MTIDTKEFRSLLDAYRQAGLSTLRGPFDALIAHIDAQLAAARAAALEEAAVLCRSVSKDCTKDDLHTSFAIEELADRISALATQPAAPTEAAPTCWSCKKAYTLGQRADADGNCPHCGVEIELDEPASPSVSEQDERAQFEAWARKNCGMTDESLAFDGGWYEWGRTADMWCAWKAARAAQGAQAETLPVTLELPDGDNRTARVVWSEVKDGRRHLCIVVDDTQTASSDNNEASPNTCYKGWTVENLYRAATQGQGGGELLAEALAVFDLMLEGCKEQKFGSYENGHGETIGPRMDALHAKLRALAARPAPVATQGGGVLEKAAEACGKIAASDTYGEEGTKAALDCVLAVRDLAAHPAPSWEAQGGVVQADTCECCDGSGWANAGCIDTCSRCGGSGGVPAAGPVSVEWIMALVEQATKLPSLSSVDPIPLTPIQIAFVAGKMAQSLAAHPAPSAAPVASIDTLEFRTLADAWAGASWRGETRKEIDAKWAAVVEHVTRLARQGASPSEVAQTVPLDLSALIDECREAAQDWEPLKPFIEQFDSAPVAHVAQGEPVAYVPIHPRLGPLWPNTIPTKDCEHPAHYPLRPVYFAAPVAPSQQQAGSREQSAPAGAAGGQKGGA